MLKQLHGVFLAGLLVSVLSLIAFSPNALDIRPVWWSALGLACLCTCGLLVSRFSGGR
jgi:hypothetical protein